MKHNNNSFDTIVIGSGIGGLTVAGILARLYKKKVLLIEKHYEAGGLTHAFKRKGYKWDVGLHYVSDINLGGLPKRVFDILTDNKLQWLKLDEPFENVVYPDFELTLGGSNKRDIDKLCKLFPEEKKAIQGYFRHCKWLSRWMILHMSARFLNPFLGAWTALVSRFGKKFATQTSQEYLDAHFKSAKLKSLLVSQWGDYGLPPSKSTFAIHAFITQSYAHGAYYPKGGSDRIARYFESMFDKTGGTILLQSEVTEIVIENKRAVGVKVKDVNSNEETIYYGDKIVSNAGIFNTYQKLLNSPLVANTKNELASFYHGLAPLVLFLGLKRSPKTVGINTGNYWIHSDYDQNNVYGDTQEILKGRAKRCFLSFGANRAGAKTNYTAQLLAFVDYEIFQDSAGKATKDVEANYHSVKKKIADGLIELAAKKLPRFKELVDYCEVGTPSTFEHYSNRMQASVYGVPEIAEKQSKKWMNVKTPIKNLYMSGSDTCTLGIIGALMGGVFTCVTLQGLSVFKDIWLAKTKKEGLSNKAKADSKPRLQNEKQIATLVKKNQISDTVYELHFTIELSVSYTPGQYVRLQLNEVEWRDYSILDLRDKKLTLLIDTKYGGVGSLFIKDISLGAKVFVRLPVGDFTLKESQNSAFFIATGTGISPLLSMIRQRLHSPNLAKGANKMSLIFGTASSKTNFLPHYIDSETGSQLHITTCLSRGTHKECFKGRVTDYLRKSAIDFAKHDFYISGNPDMVDEVSSILRERGASNIFTENY